MILWLTRQANGLHMLTALRPVWSLVDGQTFKDAYVAPGDPVGLRNLCASGVAALFGAQEVGRGESVEVELVGSRRCGAGDGG